MLRQIEIEARREAARSERAAASRVSKDAPVALRTPGRAASPLAGPGVTARASPPTGARGVAPHGESPCGDASRIGHVAGLRIVRAAAGAPLAEPARVDAREPSTSRAEPSVPRTPGPRGLAAAPSRESHEPAAAAVCTATRRLAAFHSSEKDAARARRVEAQRGRLRAAALAEGRGWASGLRQ